MPTTLPPRAIADLDDREFRALRELVHEHTGIALGPHKRALLRARLGRRLRALGLDGFGEYHRYLMERDPAGEELGRFINAVTTNQTGFFREPHHFAFLAERWAPSRRARGARGGERTVRVWSAGCSSGEEPYSIAATLSDALPPEEAWDLKILASDIDTDMLARAAAGLYSVEAVAPIPTPVLRRHFLRGTGPNAGLVRVRPELRALVTVRRINLLEAAWPAWAPFDVVFCRNVLIYFDEPTRQQVLARLVARLAPDGLLVLGHSEGVQGLVTGLRRVDHAIYRR